MSSETPGTPADPGASDFTTPGKWSIMHLCQPFWVPLANDDAITEADQNMMVGAYSDYDYT